MSSDKDTVETVERLLNERRKVAGWLEGLAARQAGTPPAVYERVFNDYTAKLDKVQAKLVAAADTVQVAAADVAAKLTDKEEALALKRDERAEAELRAAVGEFSEREWDKRRARLDDELGVLVGERDALRDELARLRAVLDEVAAKDAPKPESEDTTLSTVEAPAEDEPAPVDAVTADAPSEFAAFEQAMAAEIAAEPPTEPVADVPSEEVEPARVDEPADVASEGASAPTPVVAIEPVAAPVIPIHEQTVIAAVEPAQSLAPSFDELEFLKSVVGRTTPTPAAPSTSKRATPPQPMPAIIDENADAKAARDARAYEMPEPPTPFPDPVPEPRVSQEMTPPRESFFGRPTPRTSEAVKSLRCQECGTLNFPTEWYCERCGGELAAL